MSKRYFDILGIAPTEDEKIIKKAYRKQALKYHPDKNPSKDAAHQFLLISEAYDALMTKSWQKSTTRGKQYDFNDFTQQAKHTKEELLKERMRKARARYEYLKRKEAEETEQYYQAISNGRAWWQFKLIMIGCTLFAVIFILDKLLLPSHWEQDVATHGNRIMAYGGMAENRVVPVITKNNEKFWVKSSNYGIIDRNVELVLQKSFIFHDIKAIWVFEDKEWHRITTDFSVMGTFPIVPIILLIPLITFLIRGRTLTYSLLFNVSFYMYGIILVVLLYLNDRWAHLLTMGLL